MVDRFILYQIIHNTSTKDTSVIYHSRRVYKNRQYLFKFYTIAKNSNLGDSNDPRYQ
jgi:hypothetical protein